MSSILFVDDEEMVLSSLRRAIKVVSHSWNCQFVTSADEALSIISKETFDVVITDIKMPQMDGIQLLHNLKDNPETTHLGVIMLTGKGSEETAIKAMRLGADDYLMKDSLSHEGLERAILGTLEKLSLRRLAEQYQFELEQKVRELQESLNRVKTLEGLLPICMFCKMIRVGEDSWSPLETYVETHSDASFSHTICKKCKKKHYPEFEIPASESK